MGSHHDEPVPVWWWGPASLLISRMPTASLSRLQDRAGQLKESSKTWTRATMCRNEEAGLGCSGLLVLQYEYSVHRRCCPEGWCRYNAHRAGQGRAGQFTPFLLAHSPRSHCHQPKTDRQPYQPPCFWRALFSGQPGNVRQAVAVVRLVSGRLILAGSSGREAGSSSSEVGPAPSRRTRQTDAEPVMGGYRGVNGRARAAVT
jgi:hypothetical protein